MSGGSSEEMNESKYGIKNGLREWNEREMRLKLRQSLGGMEEMLKVLNGEHGVQCIEYGGW